MSTEKDRQKKLLREIGNVDEELIEAAAEPKHRRNPLKSWAALAACAVLAVVLALPQVRESFLRDSSSGALREEAVEETTAAGIADAEAEAEAGEIPEAAGEVPALGEFPAGETTAAATREETLPETHASENERDPEDSVVATGNGVPQAIMVDGRVYVSTGEVIELARCGVMDGEITSSVEPDALPAEDDQSNFGTGFGYQYVGEGCIDVYMNEQWIRFEEMRQE